MTTRRIKFYNSIRFRLSAIIAFVILSAVIALSAFSASKSLVRETENFRELTAGAASAYAAAVAQDVAGQNRMQTLSALRGIRDLPNISQTDITLPDGEVFVELGSGAWLLTEKGAERSLWSVDHIRVEIPIVRGGEQIGTLGMLADIRPLRTEIVRGFFVTIASAVVISLLGILIAQVFVSRLTRPLMRLTDEMASIRDGDSLKAIELKNRKDETGLLTQTFADMIGTIRDRDAQIADHMNTLEETVEIRTKDLRLARDEAEAANAAKSDFLATMSHEIRTPMNGMMVMAEMLGAADLSPRHKRYADIIHRSGNSLLTIINDILDLSKIEAGQLDLELIPTSPERLITDVVSLFWERARSKDLELATYVSPRVPQEVLIDPTRLNQVISNLVNNALKFTENGGVLIRLDAKLLKDNTTLLSIDVVDTGIGIPDDKIDHIFESFSQADQSTTRQYGGTGLGLTVCQRLVTAMQGEISVSSQVGVGSTFHVTVPVREEIAAPAAPQRSMRVGLALPDGMIRKWLAEALSYQGCTVTRQAPQLWISNSASFEAQDAPVVLLSDIGDTRADGLLRRGEAVDLIANPYTRADLDALLTRAAKAEFRGMGALDGVQKSADWQSFEGLRVLAVDDNAVNREVLREALSTLSVDAVFAEDGAQALEAFKTSDFDLVLMDGSMPVMDGFEATRQIRALEAMSETAPTPIFALTAQVAGVSETAWAEAGANGHILKPFTLEKLSSVFSGLNSDGRENEVEAVTEPEPSSKRELLDADTLATLEKLGGKPGGVRDKVWAMFEDKAPQMLQQLHAAIRAGEGATIAREAHAFKSMALSSGLKALADVLQTLEAQAKANSGAAQASDYDRIDETYAQSLAEMARRRGQSAA